MSAARVAVSAALQVSAGAVLAPSVYRARSSARAADWRVSAGAAQSNRELLSLVAFTRAAMSAALRELVGSMHAHTHSSSCSLFLYPLLTFSSCLAHSLSLSLSLSPLSLFPSLSLSLSPSLSLTPSLFPSLVLSHSLSFSLALSYPPPSPLQCVSSGLDWRDTQCLPHSQR